MDLYTPNNSFGRVVANIFFEEKELVDLWHLKADNLYILSLVNERKLERTLDRNNFEVKKENDYLVSTIGGVWDSNQIADYYHTFSLCAAHVYLSFYLSKLEGEDQKTLDSVIFFLYNKIYKILRPAKYVDWYTKGVITILQEAFKEIYLIKSRMDYPEIEENIRKEIELWRVPKKYIKYRDEREIVNANTFLETG